MLSARNNMVESQQKRIVVHAKSVKDVNDLLYFMSTDVLKQDCNVFGVIELAHFYQMDRLIWKCVNRLVQDVTVKNFGSTINVFNKHEISEGYETLVKFGKENVDELKKENNFLQLSHS